MFLEVMNQMIYFIYGVWTNIFFHWQKTLKVLLHFSANWLLRLVNLFCWLFFVDLIVLNVLVIDGHKQTLCPNNYCSRLPPFWTFQMFVHQSIWPWIVMHFVWRGENCRTILIESTVARVKKDWALKKELRW